MTLKNWKIIFPVKEEQRPKVSKRILKGFNKIIDGKTRHMDVESIGKAYLMGDLPKEDRVRQSTHIITIDVVENGYLQIMTRSTTYIVNPDDRFKKMELLLCHSLN